MPLVYTQLRSLASHYLRQERSDHTLRPTDLVHEAYLKLLSSEVIGEHRVHFMAIVAITMRRILGDHARGEIAASNAAVVRPESYGTMRCWPRNRRAQISSIWMPPDSALRARPTQGALDRAFLFRWPEMRRGSSSSRSLYSHRQSRSETCQSMASARTALRVAGPRPTNSLGRRRAFQ